MKRDLHYETLTGEFLCGAGSGSGYSDPFEWITNRHCRTCLREFLALRERTRAGLRRARAEYNDWVVNGTQN